MSLKILIVDDHAVVRHSLRSLIERHPRFYVSGEAENGEEAIEKVKNLRPDIVILDFQMPVMNGIDAARQISLISPTTIIVMVTMHGSEQLWKDAKEVGVKHLVSKSGAFSQQLLASLDKFLPPAERPSGGTAG